MSETPTVIDPNQKNEETLSCPKCGDINYLEDLQQRQYRCGKCNLELAHLDYAPNGTIRGVNRWLLVVDDVVLDHYQIKSVLGKGGFGAAYLVDDLKLGGKHRALKEVPEMLFDEYETSLLIRLDHPAIPDIIERRAVNGMVYLVLKFGGSRTLGSERKLYLDRRVPMGKLFPWMRQLCGVLVYLHSQTPPIIHRDLKPDNILLNDDERIMLVDFGIAKEAVPGDVTRTLGRAATTGFSPPEQVMGTGTDERSDIYALGATFYALLTGQNPPPAHERVAGAELLPPSQFVPDLPLEVEVAIIQSLSLNMNQRQRSMGEFALALGGVEDASLQSLGLNSNQRQRSVSEFANSLEAKLSEEIKSKEAIIKQPQAHVTYGRKSRNRIFIASFLLLTLVGVGVISYLKVDGHQPVKVNTTNLIALPVLQGDNVVTSPDGLLTIAVHHKEYKIGDKLNIQYAVARSLYMRLLYVNSSGEKGVFLPDKESPDVPLIPSMIYHYPPLDAKYEINIEGPRGMDQLVAVVSDKPVPSDVDFYQEEEALKMKPDSQMITIVRLKYLVR